MQRKPGGYRRPTQEQRDHSRIEKRQFDEWFQQIWTIPGASTRKHPAPFPLDLASRLVRMFSFTGDTVLDPFAGTGTTSVAALRAGRNSIAIDVDPDYCDMMADNISREANSLFTSAHVVVERALSIDAVAVVREAQHLYDTDGPGGGAS